MQQLFFFEYAIYCDARERLHGGGLKFHVSINFTFKQRYKDAVEVDLS